MDRSGGVFVDPQTQLVRATVVADNVQVLLRLGLLSKIDLGVEDALLIGRQTRGELLAPGRVDHAEAAAVRGVVVGISKVVDVAARSRLVLADLRADHDEAGALERDDLGEAQGHLVGDVAGPVGVRVAVLVVGLGPDERPAGDV